MCQLQIFAQRFLWAEYAFDRLLDIGCGWGTLVAYAAKNFGCDATGVTLAKNQHKFGTERIANNGVNNLCRPYDCRASLIPPCRFLPTRPASFAVTTVKFPPARSMIRLSPLKWLRLVVHYCRVNLPLTLLLARWHSEILKFFTRGLWSFGRWRHSRFPGRRYPSHMAIRGSSLVRSQPTSRESILFAI